jgi:hypothetical protein
VTLDTWHGRYDTLGRKKADVELTDGLGAEVRPKDTIEVKSVARTNSSAQLGPRLDPGLRSAWA